MPTYEYACTSCDAHVEVVQSMSAPALTACGVCGGQLRKVFHPAGILFKGSGFYSTDNRSKSKSSTENAAETKPKPEKQGDASTDKGSAPKSSAKEKSA